MKGDGMFCPSLARLCPCHAWSWHGVRNIISVADTSVAPMGPVQVLVSMLRSPGAHISTSTAIYIYETSRDKLLLMS